MTDELKEQAVMYALGQLAEDERAAFVSTLRSDAELAALVGEYEAVLGAIALSAEEAIPPASLRERILREAGGVDESTTVPFRRPIERKRSSFVPWAAAAMFAIFCGFLGLQVAELKRENAELARLNDPENIRLVALAAASEEYPDISANVAWNPESGIGFIETKDLPPAPSGKTYQLWVFEEGNPAPVSAGLFDPAASVRASFQPDRPVEKAVTFAVSLEVAGGRPQPEGPVVLAGNAQGS